MEIKQRVGRKMLLPNVKNSFEKKKPKLKMSEFEGSQRPPQRH